jgi:hypothetical protein
MWMTPRVHLEKLAIARHPSEALYNSEAGQAGMTVQFTGFSRFPCGEQSPTNGPGSMHTGDRHGRRLSFMDRHASVA